MSDRTTSMRDDPVATGLSIATERLRRNDIRPAYHQEREAERIARTYVSGYLEEAPSRAIELFVEQIAIAHHVRALYGEDSLTFDDIANYEQACREFINSYWHDPL